MIPQFFGPLMPQCTGAILSVATGERMCTLCDLLSLTDNVVKFMTSLAPIIALGFIIWGAFLIITSGGSTTRLQQGRKVITTAVVGLLIVLSAWIIVSTTFLVLTGSSQGPLPLPWYKVTCINYE